MKKPIYLILLTLLSLCFTSSNAKNIDSIQTEFMYVTAKSGLNYREEPKGEILGTFGFGQKLAVIEHTKVFGSITNNDKFKNAEWVGIQLDNTIVYAFDFYLSFENPYVYEILSPGSYLTRESDNPTEFINTNWLALHKEDNQYFLGKANYSIDVITDHLDCMGVIYTILSDNNTLIYINNSKLKTGKVKNLAINKKNVWTDEKTNFNYNNNIYTLHAEGEILPTESFEDKLEKEFEEPYDRNYRLFLSINNKQKSLLIEHKSFSSEEQHSFEGNFPGTVEILFVGDIDSDGILDFVFEANRHPKEKRVLLYLSSTADEGKNYHISETSTELVDCIRYN